MSQTPAQNPASSLAPRESFAPRAAVEIAVLGNNFIAEQDQPLTLSPLRQHTTHPGRETTSAPAGAHAPKAPWTETQHQQLPLGHEDAVDLTNDGVWVR